MSISIQILKVAHRPYPEIRIIGLCSNYYKEKKIKSSITNELGPEDFVRIRKSLNYIDVRITEVPPYLLVYTIVLIHSM